MGRCTGVRLGRSVARCINGFYSLYAKRKKEEERAQRLREHAPKPWPTHDDD